MLTRYTRTLSVRPLTLAALAALFTWFAPQGTAQSGSIAGVVVDSESGEPLIGVNVVIDGTPQGAATDLDGHYQIANVAAGSYALVFSYVSYQQTRVSDVAVGAGELVKVDVSLRPEAIGLEEVVVEARALTNTDAALLRSRQKSNAVSDAISAETISRSGSGDAAAAMTKVTGASVVGGRYVFIRGLGERYSSTHLNGAELPSADPDKKAFQLDLFPSGLLDNIQTIKTFTPDKPGNFSGGLVDVGTKDFPEQLTFSLTTSASYNSETTYNDRFTLYEGGRTDWLGFDDGARQLPGLLDASDLVIPSEIEARRDPQAAQRLDQLSRAFDPLMSPTVSTAPVNQSASLGFGNQVQFLGAPLGISASLSYAQNFSFYNTGDVGRWELIGAQVDQIDRLTEIRRLSDLKGSREASLGALASFSYKPHPAHKVKATLLRTQSGESTARYLEGSWVDLSQGNVYQTRYLGYKERSLRSMQINGEHFLPAMLGGTFEWKMAATTTLQDEPDLRYFTNHYSVRANGDTLYQSPASLYPAPARFFRDLEEDNLNLQADYSVPFRQWNGLPAKLKIGAFRLDVDRTFSERRFEYEEAPGTSYIQYGGDVRAFFEAAGIIGTRPNGQPQFGLYIVDRSSEKNNYAATKEVTAGYAMLELPLMRGLRLVGGARLEAAKMTTLSEDVSLPEGRLDDTDILPSVNAIYELHDRMNLRAAYTHTLARPTFRELAPYSTFDFVGDFVFSGNPNLERTLIRNSDLRWEWFRRPGEIIAISGFYKLFENPIERVILTRAGNNSMSVQNVPEAVVYGLELELRKALDFIPALRNLRVGGNVSLVRSSVDIPQEELTVIRAADPDAETSRRLQGQSPYLVNLDMSYENYESGTVVGLFYNVFGPRLLAVTEGAAPDVFERPRNTLDLVASQQVWGNLGIKASVKNLLNEHVLEAQRFKGETFVYQNYPLGRSVSISLSYKIN